MTHILNRKYSVLAFDDDAIFAMFALPCENQQHCGESPLGEVHIMT